MKEESVSPPATQEGESKKWTAHCCSKWILSWNCRTYGRSHKHITADSFKDAAGTEIAAALGDFDKFAKAIAVIDFDLRLLAQEDEDDDVPTMRKKSLVIDVAKKGEDRFC
jgi:hypothetical protein